MNYKIHKNKKNINNKKNKMNKLTNNKNQKDKNKIILIQIMGNYKNQIVLKVF